MQAKFLNRRFFSSANKMMVNVDKRTVCDLELIKLGALNPVDNFMNQEIYDSVVESFRTPEGKLFPLPIVLPLTAEQAASLGDGSTLSLSFDDHHLADLELKEIWQPDFEKEGKLCYGGDVDHPEVQRLHNMKGQYYVTGDIVNYEPWNWPDFHEYRRTPEQVKEMIKEKGWDKIVAFQTRNPMHQAHIQCVKHAAREHGCNVLLNPVCGPTKKGDISYPTRMLCYEEVLKMNPEWELNLLPLSMRMGGPREAMLHSIIRQNYGVTHFIVGRDHAGPGSNSKGEDIYGPNDAIEFMKKYEDELHINVVTIQNMLYLPQQDTFMPENEVPKGAEVKKISGTEVRRRLRSCEPIPEWFSAKKVIQHLRRNVDIEVEEAAKYLETQDPLYAVRMALEYYGEDCAISFSGAEDVYLIELAHQTGLPFRVFSLDTGRLHPETYEFFQRVEDHYGINIEYCFPEKDDVEALVREKGMFSFYKDGHKECCTERKVKPLRAQLSTLRAWITGVRKDQSVTRTDLPIVQVDGAFKGRDGELIKFNPLSNMSSHEVWNEIYEREVPFNDLHSRGFVSIGCEPCTRATTPGMHERNGRWWWEDAAAKECGLHPTDAKNNAQATQLKAEAEVLEPEIILVKKKLTTGEWCKKCLQVDEMLKNHEFNEHITSIEVADEADKESAGMKLAEQHDVKRAPFFIIKEAGKETVLSTFGEFKKFVKTLSKA